MPRAMDHASASDPTSVKLLARIRQGDSSAIDQLFARYLPRLRRWAHGRLPLWTRIDADTPDLVQDVFLRSIGRLPGLEPQCREALQAYFRTAVRNRIRDEHRRHARRRETADGTVPDTIDRAPSVLDRLIDDERRTRYRAALAQLDDEDRELIVGHLELDYSHKQLGLMTRRTPNAARMALHRAIGRLAARMHEE
jgi:RNA polymerase sigma-70 factor, ECF subfamily